MKVTAYDWDVTRYDLCIVGVWLGYGWGLVVVCIGHDRCITGYHGVFSALP